MRADDKPEFLALLARVMMGYGKSLPEAAMSNLWFDILAPFPPSVIAQAFTDYSMERPDFVPTPNSIAGRCRLLDGRPGDNEAWAQALLTRDPHATVVWTHEMAEAFGHAEKLLDAGDAIGARMAFKEAYTRLVSAARARGEPVQWKVSEGWSDRTGGKSKRLAIEKAQRDGLLPAPVAQQLLLAGPGRTTSKDDEVPARPEALERLKAMMATLEDPWEKAERIREQRLQEQEQEAIEKKTAIEAQVREYQKGARQ